MMNRTGDMSPTSVLMDAIERDQKMKFMFEGLNICIDNVSILRYIFIINCRFGRCPESMFVCVCRASTASWWQIIILGGNENFRYERLIYKVKV